LPRAVALKNCGAKEAERDGDCGNGPAPGSAAVPEGELLLQVSAPRGQTPSRGFPLVPFAAPLNFIQGAGCSLLIAGCFGEAEISHGVAHNAAERAEV